MLFNPGWSITAQISKGLNSVDVRVIFTAQEQRKVQLGKLSQNELEDNKQDEKKK